MYMNLRNFLRLEHRTRSRFRYLVFGVENEKLWFYRGMRHHRRPPTNGSNVSGNQNSLPSPLHSTFSNTSSATLAGQGIFFVCYKRCVAEKTIDKLLYPQEYYRRCLRERPITTDPCTVLTTTPISTEITTWVPRRIPRIATLTPLPAIILPRQVSIRSRETSERHGSF